MEPLKKKNGMVQTPEATSPLGPVWKPDLYQLQQEAPRPRAVLTQSLVPLCPAHYGREFHGAMPHHAAAALLRQDGDFLVRLSGHLYTLSLRFDGKVKHYKLYYDGVTEEHFVREDKRYVSVGGLVGDGLVTLHIVSHAGPYIQLMSEVARYEKSPTYITLTRLKKRAKPASLDQSNGPADYDKPHQFRTHTFKGLNWCEFCSNFLWGFTAQGVKCDDCGFSAHTKCSERLPADCCPDLKQTRSVFGVDLTTLVKARRTLRPFLVDMCVAQIEDRGLRTEGLYRVSGCADEMDSLRLALDKDGEKADISAAMYENINVVAGILKLYFRMLPIPLITFDAHAAIIRAVKLSSLREQIAGLQDALTLLPPAHYNTLKFLLAHLHRVTTYSNVNKMTAQNISTVLAPTLMPMPDLGSKGVGGGGVAMIPDMTIEIGALQVLIETQAAVFGRQPR